MKKPLDEKQKLALTVIDSSIAQVRQWQDFEDNFSELDKKVNKIPDEIMSSGQEIKDSIESGFSDLQDTLKKKLEEELLYEVDEQKIVDSVLKQVKIPEPIPGKDADETKIIQRVLEQIPKEEPIDIEGVAKIAASYIPKQKSQKIPKIDEEKIVASVLVKIPKLEPFKLELTQEDLLNRINKYDKDIDWKVLKNIPYDVLHGGKSSGKIGRGGATRFTQLVDTPSSYSGQAGKFPKVNAGETGLEFDTVDLSGYVPYTGATSNVNLGTYDLITDSIDAYTTTGLMVRSFDFDNIALFGTLGGNSSIFYGNILANNQTDDRILGLTGGKVITSLSTSTYPSLSELSYVKGVTSAIQTQLDGKLGGTAGAVSTSYTNVGGSGNRKALITVTTTITGLNGTPDYLVNGNTTENFFYWTGQSASGKYLRFDFGSGNKFVINEAKWYQDLTSSQGVWQWQGSNDASSWTSIGSTFTLGGSATQTQTELSGNTTAYRYYQLLGVSGSLSGSPYDREIEFKISTAITGTTVDVTGRLILQSNGNPLEIGGMTVFNGSVIYNSRPLISSQWNVSGTSIYYPVTGDTGDVGIGRVPTSGYRLDVEKIARIKSDTSNQPAALYLTNSSGNGIRIFQDSTVSPTFGTANGAVIALDNDASGLRIYDGSSTERFRFQRNGDAGFGTTSPSAKLHLVKTSEQLRLGYDASNYYSTTVGSTGGVTFNAVGSGAKFVFSDALEATTVKATTAGGFVSSDGSTGATGTFTTVDLKTVTVKDGIITSIV